jgi:hypothetical protein
MQAANMFAYGATLQVVSDTLHVPIRTLSSWKQKEDFIAEVVAQSRLMLHDGLPEVYGIVLAKAKQGIPWACQLIFKHTEFLATCETKQTENQITFNWGCSPPTAPELPEEPLDSEEAEEPAPTPEKDSVLN